MFKGASFFHKFEVFNRVITVNCMVQPMFCNCEKYDIGKSLPLKIQLNSLCSL